MKKIKWLFGIKEMIVVFSNSRLIYSQLLKNQTLSKSWYGRRNSFKVYTFKDYN